MTAGELPYAKNVKDLISNYPIRRKMRNLLRDTAVFFLSLSKRIDRTSDWIRFPYYHHVFDDERNGFARHLDYLRNYGDFISVEDAVKMLKTNIPIHGRYFCLTVDDGFKCCHANIMPILREKNVSAGFFVPTMFPGTSRESGRKVYERFFENTSAYPLSVEFMNWNEIRDLAESGMTIGSHTQSHQRISEMKEDSVVLELQESKRIIENEVGGRCVHFSCPFGIPGRDFSENLEPVWAEKAGYRSFLTTRRGPNRAGDSPFFIRRENLLAYEGTHHLRYFFST